MLKTRLLAKARKLLLAGKVREGRKLAKLAFEIGTMRDV